MNISEAKTMSLCEKDCYALPASATNTITVPADVSKKIHAAIGAKPLLFGRYEVIKFKINLLC